MWTRVPVLLAGLLLAAGSLLAGEGSEAARRKEPERFRGMEVVVYSEPCDLVIGAPIPVDEEWFDELILRSEQGRGGWPLEIVRTRDRIRARTIWRLLDEAERRAKRARRDEWEYVDIRMKLVFLRAGRLVRAVYASRDGDLAEGGTVYRAASGAWLDRAGRALGIWLPGACARPGREWRSRGAEQLW